MRPLHEDDDCAALLARIAAGDTGALARLMERHTRRMTLVALRYLGDQADAEDLVQETFVKVWERAGRYDPSKGAASTWVYRILVNGCIDRRRRRAVRAVVGLDDDAADAVADPTPDAFATVADRERLGRVREGLARLGHRQRMALLLSAVAGLDTKHVAEALGTSRGGAEQLLVRARRALRAHLEAAEEHAKGRDSDGKR